MGALFIVLRSTRLGYWRKSDFIGGVHNVIGENSLLLANWKLSIIFSNFQNKKPSIHARFNFCCCLDLPIHA